MLTPETLPRQPRWRMATHASPGKCSHAGGFAADDATLGVESDMRIVALSDQHGFLPEIPPCDLVIVAGDVCPDRFGPFMAIHEPYQQQAWFDRNVRPWLASAPATHKVLTWGNRGGPAVGLAYGPRYPDVDTSW